ncbi:MAG: response regulator transcription factor [Tepidanaerobacteraceae bacterium]|jgi:two-component system OmpR family response regulator|nr:response regulator transcription factor [Tepidanaerobacteraceae bacterium]
MSKYKILVVDDEIKILNLIKNYLENEGFEVITADDGKKAMELFCAEKPDLVVLDIMMPEIGGYDICRKICSSSATPVIMLTAKSEEVDKILGLELGADDYITKPFSLRELAARIRVVLRRLKRQGSQQDSGQDKEDILEYLGLKLDLRKKTAFLDGRPLSLTPTEFKILAMLMGSPGVVFSRLQILEEILGEYYEGYERSLDTHMSNLRKKLEDDPANPRYIKTVYGMGYKIGGRP